MNLGEPHNELVSYSSPACIGKIVVYACARCARHEVCLAHRLGKSAGSRAYHSAPPGDDEPWSEKGS